MHRPVFAARLGASALAGLALLNLPAAASDYTPLFSPVIQEMTDRLAALPDPGTTKVEKRLRKALQKGLDAAAVETEDLAQDLRVALKVCKGLEAAYPGDEAMAGLLGGLLDGLEAGVLDGHADLQDALEGIFRDKVRAKVEKSVTRADAALAAETETAVARAKALAKALKAVAKGLKDAAKDVPDTTPSTASATVDGDPWTASEIAGRVTTGAGILTITAHSAVSGSIIRISLPSGFAGAGPYNLASTQGGLEFDALPEDPAVIVSGSLQVTAYNANHHTIAGTFQFTAQDSSISHPVTAGAFDIHLVVVDP